MSTPSAEERCTELTCPAHGEVNRLRCANGGLIDAYEALISERDALAEQLRHVEALCDDARRSSGGPYVARVDVLSIERAIGVSS